MEKIILLAENSAEEAFEIREALTSAGVTNRVLRMLDGRETLAYLSGAGAYADRGKYPFPSVLLLDLCSSSVDGFGVLEWLKANVPPWELLVVVLTACDQLQNIKQAYGLGAHSFLTKPCKPEDIRNLMRIHKRYWQSAPELRPLPGNTGNTMAMTNPPGPGR